MNSVHEQCPKSDSVTVLSQKLAKCAMCTATAQPARISRAQAARAWPCRGQPNAVSVSNSALGLLYGHGILIIYENLLL